MAARINTHTNTSTNTNTNTNTNHTERTEHTEQTEISVLLIDDDDTFRERLARSLRQRGLSVRTASNGPDGIALAKQDSPEVAVVDLRMPVMNGLDVVAALRENDQTTRILVLTGYGNIPTAMAAGRLGAAEYLQKPVDMPALLAAILGDKINHTNIDVKADLHADDAAIPSLARVEWEHMQRILHDCGGNISETARRLGMHRRTLQRKLQKHPPTV